MRGVVYRVNILRWVFILQVKPNKYPRYFPLHFELSVVNITTARIWRTARNRRFYSRGQHD